MTIRPSSADFARIARDSADRLRALQVPGLEYFAPQPATAADLPQESALDQMFAYYGTPV